MWGVVWHCITLLNAFETSYLMLLGMETGDGERLKNLPLGSE